MKDWQHGYELDYLKGIESKFNDYNSIVLSPFAQMKKNKVATLLHENKLDEWSLPNNTEAWIPTNIAQQKVHVKAYGSVDVGIREKGDRLIDNPVGNKDILLDIIGKYKENIWMVINTEYNLGNEIADELGFTKVGIKVNSFSDISNVYTKANQNDMLVAPLSKIEKINIQKIGNISQADITGIRLKLSHMLKEMFTNHYSNYNKKKSWSAVSLRGYDQLPEMIEKPSEMNDKWQKENGKNNYFLQDTPLMKEFEPYIGHILNMLPAKKERVRLMKLEPDGGVLDRHTDQTDRYLGTEDGDIIRLHIPIFTNDDVFFSSWDWDGNEVTAQMREGELWYLDIRKPHRATNGGRTERVHLVIDVVANNNIRGMIENV
jgi:hypothetical protein